MNIICCSGFVHVGLPVFLLCDIAQFCMFLITYIYISHKELREADIYGLIYKHIFDTYPAKVQVLFKNH